MRTLVFLVIGVFFISISHYGQDIHLAKNYFDQGEYVKAESVYKKLYEKNPTNINLLEGLVATLQEQEKYEEAGQALEAFKEKVPQFPGLDVEIGYNLSLLGKEAEAEKYYKKALAMIEKQPSSAYRVGSNFHKYGKLEEAIIAYKLALQEKPNSNYSIRLAQVYGEQNRLEEMFSTYIDLILLDPQYYYSVNRYFAEFITSEPDNEANVLLRRVLIKRLQQEPEPAYNQILSWLYVQENDFKKAFTQEKALFRRLDDQNTGKLFQLAEIAAERDFAEVAEEILEFIIDQAPNENQKILGYSHLMNIRVEQTREKEYSKILKDFDQFFEVYGKGQNTLGLQIQYARFLAYNQGKTEEGKQVLHRLLDQEFNRFEEARIKMELADILVIEENFNQALIFYSQIKNLAKNAPLAQEALFKVAKTSYYKGDFDWAQTQLKILKRSTSELTANDALALNLLIEDNIAYDSTQTALKLFAKADLLAVQHKNKEALMLLDTILKKYPNELIEDDALYRSAYLHEQEGNYEKAEKAYLQILEYYPHGIFTDKANYFLAELYFTKFKEPEKAMNYYKKVIFDHPDSIYYVDSRKKFRKLRGDDIQ